MVVEEDLGKGGGENNIDLSTAKVHRIWCVFCKVREYLFVYVTVISKTLEHIKTFNTN